MIMVIFKVIWSLIRLALGILMTALGLLPLAVAAYWIYRAFEVYGNRIFPVAILFSVFVRRIATLLFIHIRFFTDRTSTLDHLERPEYYKGVPVKFEDKLKLFIMGSIGELRMYTDFKYYDPLPYGMGEGTKSLNYLRYSFLWTLIVTLFCVAWILGYFSPYWGGIIKAWVILLLLSATYLKLATNRVEVLMRFGRRFWYIRMTTTEILNQITFGLISSNKRMTGRRLFWCYVVGILVIILEMVYKSELGR